MTENQLELLFALKKRTGPVVRIGTNELHVNDPSVYLDITSVGSDFRKEPDFYHGISLEGTSIGGTDPEKHRVRRQVLAPAFSASTIQKLAPLVENSFKKLCEKMDSIASSVNAVNVKLAFKSFALDVISEIVFGQAFGVMEEPNFHHPYLDSLQDTIRGAWIARAFPTLSTLSRSLPKSISAVLFPLSIAQFSKTAVIKEVLRYAPSVPGRLPRVVPEGGYELYGQQLPAETSLAWCELYIVFATLFRKYEIEVFNTSDADMEWSDHLLLLFRGKDLRVKLERKKD
ncbi:MAG: hypothetical protein Q9157_001204 [Trypethelium eluteriae]